MWLSSKPARKHVRWRWKALEDDLAVTQKQIQVTFWGGHHPKVFYLDGFWHLECSLTYSRGFDPNPLFHFPGFFGLSAP